MGDKNERGEGDSDSEFGCVCAITSAPFIRTLLQASPYSRPRPLVAFTELEQLTKAGWAVGEIGMPCIKRPDEYTPLQMRLIDPLGGCKCCLLMINLKVG